MSFKVPPTLGVLCVLFCVLVLNACGGSSAAPPPQQQQPSVTLTVSPDAVTAGTSATLTWNSSNATGVTIDNGIGQVAASGSMTVTPQQTTTYTATATGPGGTANAAATLTVNPPNTPPTIQVSANPASVSAGELVTLTWTAANATAVTVEPEISEEELALSGSTTVSPTATTTYVFTATGAAGSATASTTVEVEQVAPTVTLVAEPESIIAGQSSTLQWNAEHATTITIDQGIGNVDVPSGTLAVSPGATTTYTATATGPGGTATASATVTVAAANQLAVALTASPSTITPGQSTTLSWTSQNATSVEIDQGIGAVDLNGTRSVSPTTTTTYTATAHDSGGNTATSAVTVNVVSAGGFKEKIKHIIFYMQENRSFDHYFGMLGKYRESKGLPNDIDGLPLNLLLTDFFGHQVSPFKFQTACHDVTSPGWNESHFFAHRRNGAYLMDFWMRQQTDSQGSTIDPHYTRTMGYYDADSLPYYYELATQFATSDRFFSSMMGPTVPNRIYLYSGTSAGEIRPLPAGHPQYTMKTIFEQLTEAGVVWRYYYQDSSVFLPQFTAWNDPVNQGRVRHIREYYDILSRPDADQLLAPVIFIEQAAETQLNEHPSNVWGFQPGVANTKKIVDALMNSSAWQSSVFLLLYDEGGGLFDHVPPAPMPHPDGIPPKFQAGDLTQDGDGVPFDFNESGFRVPFIMVSPWVKKNFVSHTPRDFGSVLRLIQTRFDLPPLTARDAAADNMLEFFDFTNPSWMTPPPLPEQPYRNAVYVQKYKEMTGVDLPVDPNALTCDRNLGKDPSH